MTLTAPDDLPVRHSNTDRLIRISRLFLILSLVVVVAVAMSFLLLALPANDDFVRATLPTKMGYWKYFMHLYTTWQGRWVSYGIEDAILPHARMTRFYPALIGGLAIVDLAGLWVVCRFFTRFAPRRFSLACTAALAAVLWAMMPSLSETLYWFVGGLENITVLALAGALVVGLMGDTNSIVWKISAAVLAVLIVGFHESYGAILCVALAAGTLAACWMGSKNKTTWAIVLIAAVVGLGIVVAAPGNRNRMHQDVAHRARTVSVVMKLAGQQFWNSSRIWLFDPKLLAASLFVAFSPGLETSRPIWPNARRVPWRLIIPLAWLTMLAAGFLAPSYGFVAAMPGRTLSGNFLIFTIGWLVIVFIYTRQLDLRDSTENIRGLRSAAGASVVLMILSASLLLGGNTLEAIHDLATRKVFRWHDSVEHRYALLSKPGPADREVPPLAPKSRLFYSGEIWPDAPDWHIEDFFGLKSLQVKFPAGKQPAKIPEMEPNQAQ